MRKGMNTLLCFIILTASLPLTILTATEYGRRINVGTALFSKRDSQKKYWSSDEVFLLNARSALQAIIPKHECIPKSSSDIKTFLQYYKTCFSTIKTNSHGETQHLFLLALADTFGGYFRSDILPASRKLFYAGNMEYKDISEVHALYDHLKAFLHTNGESWRPPSKMDEIEISVEPAELPQISMDKPCTQVALETTKDFNGESIQYIPLPRLDNNKNPNSIIIPLKKKIVQPLNSSTSESLLKEYFTAASACLSAIDIGQMSIFYQHFYYWIFTSVIPHLSDEKLYVAFGGIMRIVAYLKEQGVPNDIISDSELLIPDNIDSKKSYFKEYGSIPDTVSLAFTLWVNQHFLITMITLCIVLPILLILLLIWLLKISCNICVFSCLNRCWSWCSKICFFKTKGYESLPDEVCHCSDEVCQCKCKSKRKTEEKNESKKGWCSWFKRKRKASAEDSDKIKSKKRDKYGSCSFETKKVDVESGSRGSKEEEESLERKSSTKETILSARRSKNLKNKDEITQSWKSSPNPEWMKYEENVENNTTDITSVSESSLKSSE